jgi:choice-of-anchor B domain-containing protein
MKSHRYRRRTLVAMMASLALTTGAVLWVTIAPGAGAPDEAPDYRVHQQRYQQVFDSLFKDVAPQARQAAQRRYQQAFVDSWQPAQSLPAQSFTPCVDGHAGTWPCKNLDLLSFLPMSQLGGGNSNDVWGWTDPLTQKEYAILGRSTGTSFVDISTPTAPVYLGNLPSYVGSSSWRAIKVYKNFAYVVADALSTHGMQVFDLTRLRSVPNPPVTFSEDYHYSQMGNTHTLAVNEETGYLYAVGSNTCSGGLHMIDVHTNPAVPTFAGCYSGDGYVHETQCVVYRGPDADYYGHEVCFAHDEDTVTIVDVTNKSNPLQISRTPYSGSGYTHQGWLTDNQRTLVVNDELDEIFYGHNVKTRFFDVRNLDSIPAPRIYTAPRPNIDHNEYVIGRYIYQSQYRAGLRVLTGPPIREIAYFDVYPADDTASFNGSWNNYPFFASGVIVVGGIEQGLFVLKPSIALEQGSTDFIS